jgi:hypothetical protein
MTCPFCSKGVRTDNYPSHLKTELKKLEVTDADSMEKHLSNDPNNLWSSLGTLNILVQTTTLSNNTLHYRKGVCFDCHRVIVNKPTTLSNTEVFEQHDCDKRKRNKTQVIEHVKTTVTLSDESKLLKDVITTCEKVVAKHQSLSDEQKTELAYEYKKVKEVETEQKDILLGLFKHTLQYFIPKVKARTALIAPTSDDSWFKTWVNKKLACFEAFGYDDDIEDTKQTIIDQCEMAETFEATKDKMREDIHLQIHKSVQDEHHQELEELRAQIAHLKKELTYACNVTKKSEPTYVPPLQMSSIIQHY